MRKRLAAVLLAPLLTLPAAALADTSLGIRAGTLGGGVELSHALGPHTGFRVNADAYNRTQSRTEDNIEYDAKLKLQTTSLSLDLFPFANNFRITAGAIVNGNKLTMHGQPTGGTFVINGTTYNASDVGSLDAKVDFKRTVPYFGIGYGRPINSGLSLIFDLGVLFQGSPKSHIDATCGAATPPATCTQIQSDAAAEQARLDDSLHSFKYYPVISLGLAYTF
ncbi:MAG TPA: hypothetical protein VFI80_00735 [Burkholderiales bacterium]|nr:hypothetical protein [Burkholderiales bacterium]